MAATSNIINLIIAYESGELTDEGILSLFSALIKNGMAWTLQGSYGRAAAQLINSGIIDRNGNILRHADELED